MVQKKIEQFITKAAQERGIKVSHSTDLFESGVFDSLEIIEFLTFLEDEMQVSFEFADLNFENFQTMETIIEWLKANGK